MQGTKAEDINDLGLVGEKLVPGEERTFVDPICNHTSLFNCGKYISLDLVDNLDLRYTFGDAFYGGAWSEGSGTTEITGLNDTSLNIKGLELWLTRHTSCRLQLLPDLCANLRDPLLMV